MTETTDPHDLTFFCSTQSRELGEETLGSAPRADVWFMLEYAGRWGSKAFNESQIADAVKEGVNAQLGKIPNSRLQFIKHEGQPTGEIDFFVAAASLADPKLYHFSLNSYEELADLDLIAMAIGDAKYEDSIAQGPIFAVCVNGLRDKCCARNGVIAYQELREEFGDMVWQSTHHGGHRFGANLLCQPYGLSYGRMDLGNAVETVEALLEGRIPLANFRGRTIYDILVQAAEGLLRGVVDIQGLNPPRLIESYEANDSEWEVQFNVDGQMHQVRVHKQATEEMFFVACDSDKQGPLLEFRLMDHAAA